MYQREMLRSGSRSGGERGGERPISGVKKVWTSAQVEAIKEAQQREERRLQQEGKWEAEERRRKALEEAERKRKEQAESRQKAMEAEMKRMLAEEEERERMERAEARRREEAELARVVVERRRQEEDREKRLKEEMEAKRRREREELREKVRQEKFKKFEQPAAEERRETVPPTKIKKSVAAGNNPLVSRFEGMAQFHQAQEDKLREKVEATKKKRHQSVVMPAKDKIRKSAQKLTGLLKGKSKNKLTRAISKEIEKVLSRENVQKKQLLIPEKGRKGRSRERMAAKFRSNSKGSLSRLGRSRSREGVGGNPLKRSRSTQKFGSDGRSGDRKTVGEMQNYLISRVLFDGEEGVVSVQSKKARRQLADVTEETTDNSEQRRKAEEEVLARERAFNSYKEEMEKYLSLFGDAEDERPRTSREADEADGGRRNNNPGSLLSRKPLAKLEDIKGRFENSAAAPDKDGKKPTSPAVGKLQVKEMFAVEKAEDESRQEKEKEYVPVIIDGDAFKRTMTKFEDYRQEEDLREKRKREVEAKAEERRREKERKRAEEEEKKKREEEEKLEEEERRRTEEEKRKEENKEEELRRKITEELEKLRKLEEEQRQRAAKENKKKELMKEIQEEVDRIKKAEEAAKKEDDDEEDDTPKWIKMITDSTERKTYLGTKKPNNEREVSEKVSSTAPLLRRASSSGGSSTCSYASCHSQTSPATKPEEVPYQREDSSTFDSSVQAMLDMLDEDQAKALADEIGLAETDGDHVDATERDAEPPSSLASPPKCEKELQREEEMRSFDDSVQAMLDLMGEDECRMLAEEIEHSERNKDKEEKQKKTTIKTQPRSAKRPLINIKEVKSALLEQKARGSEAISLLSPPPPPPPPKPIGLMSVNQARDILVAKFSAKKEARTSSQPSPSSSSAATAKCDSIKKILDRKTQNVPKGPVVKKKKAIIDVPVVSTIDEQLQQAKDRNRNKKWNYQTCNTHQAGISDSSSTTRSISKEHEKTAAKRDEEAAARSRVQDKIAIENRLKLLYPEQDGFISEVYDYVKSSRTSQEDDHLKNLVNTYLELSEKGDKGESGKKRAEFQDFKFVPSTQKIKQQLITGKEAGEREKKPAFSVGKIKDPDALLKTLESDVPKRTPAVDSYACQFIKAKYEKLDRATKEVEVGMSKERQRAIQKQIWGSEWQGKQQQQQQVEVPKKAQREWTWKKKMSEAMNDQASVKRRQEEQSADFPKSSTMRKNEDIEKLEENKRLIMESAQKREEEFLEIMEELKSLQAKGDGALVPTVDFDSALESYLEAVDRSPERGRQKNLPSLVSSVKVQDIKSQLEGGSSASKGAGAVKKAVGKISPFVFDSDKKEEKGNTSPVLGALHTNKIKRLFEERQRREKTAAGTGKKAATKVWQPLQRPRDPPDPPDSVRVKETPRWRYQMTKPPDETAVPSESEGEKKGSNKKVIRKPLLLERRPVSDWSHITDPEEKRRAILAKHGFKPREARHNDSDDDMLDDLDTIPSHILKDEILYQRYMRQQLNLDSHFTDSSSACSSSESLPSPTSTAGRKSGSSSSFAKALGSFKKLTSGKERKSGGRKSKSTLDVSGIPDTCQNLKRKFDRSIGSFIDEFGGGGDRGHRSEKRRSCSDLKDLWEQKLNPSSSKQKLQQQHQQKEQHQRREERPKKLVGKHVQNVKNKLKTGEDPTAVVKKFFDKEQYLSGSKGQYVKQAREALIASQKPNNKEVRNDFSSISDDFQSEDVNGIMRMLQTGTLSLEECERCLDQAEQDLKSKYFDRLCRSVQDDPSAGTRTANLQDQLVASMMAPSQQSQSSRGVNPLTAGKKREMERKLGAGGELDSVSEWHRRNYQEEKDRIDSELQALRGEGSLASARDELSRKLSGQGGGGGRRHFDAAAQGGGAVKNLKGQLVRQFSAPERPRPPQLQRQQSSKDAVQERARQLFLQNCNELQQLSNRTFSPEKQENVNALRGKLATNFSQQQQQQQQRQQRRQAQPGQIPKQDLEAVFNQPHHGIQHSTPFSKVASSSARGIAQLQGQLISSSLLQNPQQQQPEAATSSPPSSDAVATVREKLENLFNGSSEEWNQIFPPDCESCSDLRRTLEVNLRKNQMEQQQQLRQQPTPREGQPSSAVSLAQKGLIRLMSNEYDKSSSGRKGGFAPTNTGSIAEKQKVLLVEQQQQQQQQQQRPPQGHGLSRQSSNDMAFRRDRLESLFSGAEANGGGEVGKLNFDNTGGQRCSAMQKALCDQLFPDEQGQQQDHEMRHQRPTGGGGSHNLAATRSRLDSFFSGGGGGSGSGSGGGSIPSYHQPSRTKSCSDMRALIERKLQGAGEEEEEEEDGYKNGYGALESGRSDRVHALRKQLSDFYKSGDGVGSQSQPRGRGGSDRHFPRSRGACSNLKAAIARQQAADASFDYEPYDPSDCPTSDSVTSLRNRLADMWNESSSSSSQGQRSSSLNVGLQQTKSCSNLRNMLQDKWSGRQQQSSHAGKQVAVVAPSVSVSNMKNLFDSCYSSLPQSERGALALAGEDPARRKAFEQMMHLLESGTSTLEGGGRSAAYAELENLHRVMALRNLDDAPGADHSDFERQREELRRELDAVRTARGTIDKALLARLISGEERGTQQQHQGSGMEAELEAVRARRRAKSVEDVNEWHRQNYQEQKDRIQMELEALRGRVKASLLKIERGGSSIDRERLEEELEAVRAARKRYNILESELASGGGGKSGAFTERQRIQNELAALRESRKGSSLNRINFGDADRRSSSKGSSDLDVDTLRNLRKSNTKVKAMLESSAPKYRFGGSGEKMLQESEDDDELMLRPRRPRAAQQQKQPEKEERKWVADTINKYFDVIVEEEEEEGAADRSAKASRNYDDEDDENKEIFYPDSDEDENEMTQLGKGEQLKSTSNIRGMLSQVLFKVSSRQGASREALVGKLKHKLGEQISGGGNEKVKN